MMREQPLTKFIKAWCLLTFLCNLTCSFRLELYDDLHFEGIFYNQDLLPLADKSCENLPEVARKRASSLKTESCIVVYTEPNCEWYSYTIQAGDHENLSKLTHTNQTTTIDESISSFHLCNQNIGGIPGAIELHGYYEGKLGPMVEYRDLCGCVNLPKFAYGQIEKIDNFGNCFDLFDQPDCPEGSVHPHKITIMGGHSSGSNDLGLLEFDGELKSLQPCPGSNAIYASNKCGVNLHAVLKSIEIDSNWEPTDDITTAGVSAKTVITNAGSGKISQDIMVTKEVEETYAVERSATFSDEIFKSFDISGNLDVDIKLKNVPFLKANLQASVEAAYSYNQSTLNSNSEQTSSTTRTKRTFTITETLEIPGCTEYTVDSMVKVSEKVKIEYTAVFEITGKRGLALLTTAELLEFVSDACEENGVVELTTKAFICADFGFEAVIVGEGKPIPSCV